MRTSGGQLENDTFLGVSFGDQRGVRHLHRETHIGKLLRNRQALSARAPSASASYPVPVCRVPPAPAAMRRRGSGGATAILE